MARASGRLTRVVGLSPSLAIDRLGNVGLWPRVPISGFAARSGRNPNGQLSAPSSRRDVVQGPQRPIVDTNRREVNVLQPHDPFRFDSRRPRWFRNRGNAEAKVLSLFARRRQAERLKTGKKSRNVQEVCATDIHMRPG